MKVALISKFSGDVGGVERHIADLREGLLLTGVETALFSMDNLVDSRRASLDPTSGSVSERVATAGSIFWNREARSLASDFLADFRPDVIHYHSIYHQLSPSVLGLSDAPAVMTLHDYKLAAPCYTLVRDGHFCDLCVGRTIASPAVRYRCVKSSRGASLICATEDLVHRHRYRKKVEKYIVPSQFSCDVLARAGIPSDEMFVVPWGVDPQVPTQVRATPDPYLIYAGRLHPTKGVVVLLDAWRKQLRHPLTSGRNLDPVCRVCRLGSLAG